MMSNSGLGSSSQERQTQHETLSPPDHLSFPLRLSQFLLNV